MNHTKEPQISKYLRTIFDSDQEIRINAINQLGEIGDALCLRELREHLNLVTREREALITSITKLEAKLGIK